MVTKSHVPIIGPVIITAGIALIAIILIRAISKESTRPSRRFAPAWMPKSAPGPSKSTSDEGFVVLRFRVVVC